MLEYEAYIALQSGSSKIDPELNHDGDNQKRKLDAIALQAGSPDIIGPIEGRVSIERLPGG